MTMSENRGLRGETGAYYTAMIARRRAEDPEAWVQASKRIGWQK